MKLAVLRIIKWFTIDFLRKLSICDWSVDIKASIILSVPQLDKHPHRSPAGSEPWRCVGVLLGTSSFFIWHIPWPVSSLSPVMRILTVSFAACYWENIFFSTEKIINFFCEIRTHGEWKVEAPFTKPTRLYRTSYPREYRVVNVIPDETPLG